MSNDYELDLLQYASRVRRRWKWIVGITVVGGLLGFLLSLSQEKEYTSKTVLLVEEIRAGAVNVARHQQAITTDTFIYFLTNGYHLKKAIEKLGLNEGERPIAVHELERRVRAQTGRNTSSIELFVTMKTPELAQRVAEALIEEATRLSERLVREDATASRSSIEQELQDLRGSFQDREREWRDYLEKTQNELALARIAEGEIELRTLQEDLSASRAAMAEAEKRYTALLAISDGVAPTKVLRHRLSVSEGISGEDSEKLKAEGLPTLLPLALDSETENEIATHVQIQIVDATAEYQGGQARVRELEQSVENKRLEQREIQEKYNRTRTIADRLEHEYEVVKEAYARMYAQYAQTAHEVLWERQRLKLLAPPVEPSIPSGPKRSMNAVAGAFLAALGGGLVALTRKDRS